VHSSSHRYDVEARVPDTDRDPLGADTSSAASFGVASIPASGSARLFGPGGVRRSRPVRGEGPRVSGERPRVTPEALQRAICGGGRVTPPAKSQLSLDEASGCQAQALEVSRISEPDGKGQ